MYITLCWRHLAGQPGQDVLILLVNRDVLSVLSTEKCHDSTTQTSVNNIPNKKLILKHRGVAKWSKQPCFPVGLRFLVGLRFRVSLRLQVGLRFRYYRSEGHIVIVRETRPLGLNIWLVEFQLVLKLLRVGTVNSRGSWYYYLYLVMSVCFCNNKF